MKSYQIEKRKLKFVALVCTLLVTVFASGWVLRGIYSSSTIPVISPQSYVETASYVVWADISTTPTTYWSKNGQTGEVASQTNVRQFIQNTWLSASSNGVSFYFKSGVYSITDGLHGVDLNGNNIKSIELAGEQGAIFEVGSAIPDTLFLIHHFKGVYIHGLEFDGQRSLYTQNTTGFVISADNSTIIENCVIHDFIMNAIYTTSWNGVLNGDIIIKDSTIYNIGGHPLSSSINLASSYGQVIVENSEIRNTTGNGSTGGQALYIQAARTIIRGNYIHDCYSYIDIKSFAASGTRTNTLIEGNKIVNIPTPSSNYNVAIDIAQPTIIENNLVIMGKSGSTSIEVRTGSVGSKIMNNILNGTNTAMCGIELRGSSVGTEIIGNTIVNFFSFGIYMYEQNARNIISHNLFTGMGNKPIYEASSSAPSVITDNDVSTDNSGYTILVTSSGFKFANNIGFVTENSGTATISASTSVTFNHGLVHTPTGVWASFNSTTVTGWTWTATSTQITITVTPLGTYRVYWETVYQP